MLSALIANSVRLRVVVLALCVVLLVVGSRSIERAPLDVFPEFAPPLVEIQTEAPGLSTEEVEALVTVPLENALNGIPDVKTIRSKSVLGLSSVVLILEDGTDLLQRPPARAGARRPPRRGACRPSPGRRSSCRRSRRPAA